MIFSDLGAWSVILALCSVVMLIEGAIIIRSLVVFRRASWRFVIAVIPLAVGLWSFLVAINASGGYSTSTRNILKAGAQSSGAKHSKGRVSLRSPRL